MKCEPLPIYQFSVKVTECPIRPNALETSLQLPKFSGGLRFHSMLKPAKLVEIEYKRKEP
jgi:hypothetical protein